MLDFAWFAKQKKSENLLRQAHFGKVLVFTMFGEQFPDSLTDSPDRQNEKIKDSQKMDTGHPETAHQTL